MDNSELKRQLRLQMKQLRKSFGAQKIEQASAAVTENCLQGFEWKNIKSAQVYLPIAAGKEINTWPLIRRLWELYPHITTAVPVVRNNSLYSATINKETVLQPARYGTVEPLHPSLLPGNYKFDIIIVPLLGFDRRGHRLGYGKGYYDKFLKGSSGISVGLTYGESEIKPQIPNEIHDVELNFIVTEDEVRNLN